MIAKLNSVAYTRDGDCLLTISTREDCGKLMDELGADIDVTVKKHRQRRSLDANAYAWVLIDKLAARMGITKTEAYQQAVRNVGGNSDIVCIRDKAVAKLREGWEKNGVGWVTDTFPSKLAGCTNVILYYGSSTFDTEQMSRMIDNIVQDCKALGIETMPPDKLAAMLEEYGQKRL